MMMMKLWIVFYILGNPVLVAGPLDGSIEKCQDNAAFAQLRLREENRAIPSTDITVECIQSPDRPWLVPDRKS
jgi:hypothetical protein